MMTNKQYNEHYDRIYKMLSESGDYDNWPEYSDYIMTRDDVLDTDTRLILSVPDLNPEYF